MSDELIDLDSEKELLKNLNRILLNEKSTSNLLPYEEDIVEKITNKIKNQVKLI